MTDEQIEAIVVSVIERAAVHLGADGKRGTVLVVVTGATAGFTDSVQSIRDLVLQGCRVRLLFSEAAKSLSGDVVIKQLAGFPHIGKINPADWFSALREVDAVAVPLLSLNTAARVSLLMPDQPAANAIVHAMIMGKPVIAATDGADPKTPGGHWEKLGYRGGNPAMERTARRHLAALSAFGCRLVSAARLAETTVAALSLNTKKSLEPETVGQKTERETYTPPGRVVTAAHVRAAGGAGADLSVGPQTPITPLARETAKRLGVRIHRR